MNLEEQIEKGKRLISQGKALGKDTRALEERVMALEAQLKECLKENHDNTPSWYTEEDHKAKAVLEGVCKGCNHLLPVRDDIERYEFNGLWCAAFKKKLEAKIESCPGLKPISEGLSEIIAKMKEQGELYGI